MSPIALFACSLLASADPAAVDPLSALESALVGAIARAEPSVVAIARIKGEPSDKTTAIRGQNPNLAAPADDRLIDQGRVILDAGGEIALDFGSGVVIGERGEILTAFHVVRGASRLKVRAPGRPEFEAELIAADPRSDLAVIAPRETNILDGRAAPDAKPPAPFRPIAIGDASTLRKGSFLVALGNPFNAARDGSASASWGILANVARRLDTPPEEFGRSQFKNLPTLLQLDAKLNLGMSGGAVINLKGELVGLTTGSANAAGFDAQAGYAIPMDALGRQAVEALRQGKEVEYGFLGVLLDNAGGTNQVGDARPGTPAGEGGVRSGDFIVEVGSQSVTDADTLILAVNAQPVGRPVAIHLIRSGKPIEKTVVLAKYPVHGEVIATNRPAPWRGLRVDYVSTMAQNQGAPDVLGAMARGGVGVVEVLPATPADRANLRTGQVILRVEGRPTRTPDEFAKAVADRTGPVILTTDLGPITIK